MGQIFLEFPSRIYFYRFERYMAGDFPYQEGLCIEVPPAFAIPCDCGWNMQTTIVIPLSLG